MIDRTLDHYRIDSKLGEGGMGVVYRARDTHLDRFVAIKVLPADKLADPDRKHRFVREARAASALNHPGIVTIYDIRSEGDVDFIVMEYIEGRTLDELIAPAGMRAAQALKHAVQIADALSKAHGAGILHRDIKPSNVMVTEEGRVKVLDFGLAKLCEPEEPSPDAPTLTRPLTEEGATVGTAAYMSPEQAEGRKLDARTDIFSFGVLLYELVTGRKPFTGDSRLAILSKVLNEDPAPPRLLGVAIPPDLEKAILRCLRKDPARRYQTMADLKVALEDVAEESVSDKPVQPTGSRRRWVVAALLAALLAAGVVSWRAWRARESTEPLRAVPLTTVPGVSRYPSFSPDGNHVAYTWTGPKQDNPDVYVQQIGSGSPLRLTTDPGNDYNPVWSPDGRSIAFLRSPAEAARSELRLIPPLGGPERKLAEVLVRGGVFLSPPYLAWCPDNTCLVVTDSPGEGKPDALFVISLETGERRQLTDPQPPALGDATPTVSPDGRWLVFRRSVGGLYTGELYRLALGKSLSAAGEPQRLTLAALDADYPTFMPDGKQILFSARGSLWRLVVGGEAAPTRLPFVGEDGLMAVVSSPQPGRPSRLVYVRSFQDFNIWRLETSAAGVEASSPPVVTVASTRGDSMVQLSPDGRRLAFTSDRSGNWEIWLSDPDGSNLVQLTSLAARASGYPHWSPDGKEVVFHSNVDGQWEVYRVPAAGGKPRNLTSHPANDTFPSFSRDGRWIYVNSNRTGTGESQIWKIPASGGAAVKVTNTTGWAPSESPDGADIYYVETMDKPSPLWRVPASGGDPVKVLEGVFLANFVVLEGGIYYIDRPAGQVGAHYMDRLSGETRLQYFDFATRRSTILARNLGNVDLPLTASRDGRLILYSREDSWVDDLMLVENFR